MDSMEGILRILKDPTLSYRQRLTTLAKAAENSIAPIAYSPATRRLVQRGVIFEMFEGAAPYRPRYVVPDYARFLRQGSGFLSLDPPRDIWEAVGNLLCIYHNVPGVNGLPVYAGALDSLLEPFVEDEAEAKKAMRLMLTHMDRAVGDAFFHANLGPADTRAGRILLELTAGMQRPVPNLSLLYRGDTPDDYALAAIRTGLISSKPSFANDALYRADMGDYAVVSCYNTLPIGGVGLTLVRLNLHEVARLAQTPGHFLDAVLPDAVAGMCEVIDRRSRFIVEDCGYFENEFLHRENLIYKDDAHMVGMFGYVGLAECVNTLLDATQPEARYGHSAQADAFGLQIMARLKEEIGRYKPKYGKVALHAQVGVMEDTCSTPGGRIPIGEEIELTAHIHHFARMHEHCAAGCGELFAFDQTVKNNPEYVLDIIKGAFAVGTRYISFYCNDADVVRITGYLVKRSDMEKLKMGQAVTNDATVLGKGISENLGLLNRKERTGK